MSRNINDFAFCVVSYNQERYVFQHLESIRSIIEKYANGLRVQLVFSDDCSKDATIIKAKFWIDKYSYLFNEVNVLEHKHNQGTIRNILDAIDSVNAKEFKLLGCDDLYYDNDIFKIKTDGGIVICNDIEFWEDGKVNPNNYMEFFKMFCNKNSAKLKNFIKRRLEYDQVISPVATFVSLDIWKDKKLREYLLRYVYIEDLPLWYYLFNKYEKEFNIKISDTRYTLYRLSVGISSDLKKPSFLPVSVELAEMRKEIKQNKHKYSRTINPYRLFNKFQNYYYRYLRPNKTKKKYFVQWDKDVSNAAVYYKYILGKARLLDF